VEHIPEIFWILLGAGFCAWAAAKLIRAFWGRTKQYLAYFGGSMKGITLIEVLVIIAILGILAAVVVPRVLGY